METGKDLQNRTASGTQDPRGSEAVNADIQRMKGTRATHDVVDLETLRKRIEKARTIEPPSGDDAFAKGCFTRGRDAVLSVLDGETPA